MTTRAGGSARTRRWPRTIKAADSSPQATIRHVLHGIESVPQAFEITAHKGKYQAINPAQVMMSAR